MSADAVSHTVFRGDCREYVGLVSVGAGGITRIAVDAEYDEELDETRVEFHTLGRAGVGGPRE